MASLPRPLTPPMCWSIAPRACPRTILSMDKILRGARRAEANGHESKTLVQRARRTSNEWRNNDAQTIFHCVSSCVLYAFTRCDRARAFRLVLCENFVRIKQTLFLYHYSSFLLDSVTTSLTSMHIQVTCIILQSAEITKNQQQHSTKINDM